MFNSMRALGSVLILSGSAIVAGGCQSDGSSSAVGGQKVGAQTVVKLESEPKGAEAYMIPLKDWDAAGGAAKLNDAQWLSKHKYGTTPVERAAKTYPYVYVVKSDGRERLIPAVKQVVKKIAPERGEMIVELIPGM